MWPRLTEVVIALWLSVSVVVFDHDPTNFAAWSDRSSALAIMILSLGSIFTGLRRLHLLNLLVAVYLIIVGFVAANPASPVVQNDILVGLLIMMLAIIPTEASQPPPRWRELAH